MRFLPFCLEVVRMAWADLTARPLRAILSVASFSSSIAIAVVLLAGGDGLHNAVREILRSIGDGQITITPGRTTGVGGNRRSGRMVRIRHEDVMGIESELPSLAGIAPFYDLRGGGAASRRYSIPFSPVRAVSQEYFEVRRLPLLEGRWFTVQEEDQGEWVAVLNEGVRNIVFPGLPAIGETIEWRGRKMTVIGVVRDEVLFPYILFLPYTTVSHMADTRYISGLIARPAPGASWNQAVAEVRRVLAGLGDFDPTDEHALEIEDNRDFTARIAAASRALHALVITIAIVSLFLGGLGVANMMVIGVTERTREIGLRKALGAPPQVIFLQVLCEALAIIALGGGVGIAAGAIACEAVGSLEMSSKYAADVGFNAGAAFLAIAALAVVGLLAGLIPARRAAALSAAEALRWE